MPYSIIGRSEIYKCLYTTNILAKQLLYPKAHNKLPHRNANTAFWESFICYAPSLSFWTTIAYAFWVHEGKEVVDGDSTPQDFV